MGIPAEKITTIYDGVDFESNKAADKNVGNNLRDGVIQFVMIGSLSESKGQKKVIEAVAGMKLSDRSKIHIDMWGASVNKVGDELGELIEANNLKEVVSLRGFSKDISNNLSKYDVGINASREEAFGRTTIEYLANGIPVLGANSGATTEIVKSDYYGLLFDRDNIDDLREKMLLFTNSIGEYRKRSEDLKEYAMNCFSARMTNESLVRYFMSIFSNTFKGEK